MTRLPPTVARELVLAALAAARGVAERAPQHQLSLLDFTTRTFPGYHIAPHHQMLADHLEAVERGELSRLIVEIPPRHGKSELVSVRFPAWYLGNHPERNVIVASHTAELAHTFSRTTRDLLTGPDWPYPHVGVRYPNVKHWVTTAGGGYIAVGVRGPLTGKGASLIVIDDPVKNDEEAQSETIREATWQWYLTTARTRMTPSAARILTMCMTGDTRVLMADGTEKALRDVRPRDAIATYEHGRLSTTTVERWSNNGPDSCFGIRTSSGTIVKANERHPFLVARDGGMEWVRLRDIKVGDRLLRASAIGESGETLSVHQRDVTSRRTARVTAPPTTISTVGPADIARHPSILMRAAPLAFGTDTALISRCTKPFLLPKGGAAPFVGVCLSKRPRPIGGVSSVSITTVPPGKFADCCVTTAISPLAMRSPKPSSFGLLSTYEMRLEHVVEIVPVGREDVFDIQVARTENFIANGLVSHNTRWHDDDLIGRVLNSDQATSWTRLRLPALAEDGDPLGRSPGAALWPVGHPDGESFDEAFLLDAQQEMGLTQFSALYQQNPAPAEGNLFKVEWMKRLWRPAELPRFSLIIQTIDASFKTGVANDYSVIATWGISATGDYYLLDCWRKKREFPELEAATMAAAAQRYGGQRVGATLIEDEASGTSLIQVCRRKAGITVVPVKPANRAKLARAQAVTPVFEAGKVVIPAAATWLPDWLTEHLRYPAAPHDDQVDTTAMALAYFRTRFRHHSRRATRTLRYG